MNALLKWGIQVAIITFAAFMINQYGWWELLYNTDTTNISFVIVGVSNSLITILVGLICSTTIKLQMMLYENT